MRQQLTRTYTEEYQDTDKKGTNISKITEVFDNNTINELSEKIDIDKKLIFNILGLANEIHKLKKESKFKGFEEKVTKFDNNLKLSIEKFNISHSTSINKQVPIDDDIYANLLLSALQYALKIEHSTIPPYLTALYSIKRGTNSEVVSTIRSVAVEEMLHMIMVCNVLNSMGYKSNILAKKLIPSYPYKFPFGEESANKSFYVNIDNLSEESIQTFIDIESPVNKMVKPLDKSVKKTKIQSFDTLEDKEDKFLMNCFDSYITSLPFEKIGVFYEFITVLTFVRQWKFKKANNDTFYNDFLEGGIFEEPNLNKQISSDQYYGSGGKLLTVRNFDDFLEVVNEITGQGEGSGGEMIAPNQLPDQEDLELAHYFRFMEVKHGKYYKGGNYSEFKKKGMPVKTPPRGKEFKVDWDAVYNIQTNLKIDNVSDEGIQQMLIEFNNNYRSLLDYINKAVSEVNKDQQNEFLQKSIMHMHQMHHQAEAIMKIPLGNGMNAAPTWEV